MASERTIEKYCTTEAKAKGGKAVKGNALNTKGFPDRIILLPSGKVGFLELKATGKKPTKLQTYWINLLNQLGFKASYADSKQKVKEFIDDI